MTSQISIYFIVYLEQNSITYRVNHFRGDIIRLYYYDAVVDENNNPEFGKQREYFDLIADKNPFYTVRLGKLVKSSNKGFKQKGVEYVC